MNDDFEGEKKTKMRFWAYCSRHVAVCHMYDHVFGLLLGLKGHFDWA